MLIKVLIFRFSFKTFPLAKVIFFVLYFERSSSLFLHCVDSRFEENGSWHSRFHLGPFFPNSRLQVGTRLRRSLLNDFVQTFVVAVELDGAVHEFSRVPGVKESVLDLLFQFRKITFYAPFINFQEIVVVPFLFLVLVFFMLKILYGHTKFIVGNQKFFWVHYLRDPF